MAFNFSPKVVTDGLVLYLDAANSKSIISGSTTWTDLSRGGNNGTLVNGPTFNSANGGSIVFDGSNDYATLPSIGVSTLSAFSVSFWAKTFGASLLPTVYAEGTPSSWPSNLFIMYFGGSEDGGKPRVWFGYPTISNPLIGTTVVTDNKWYYVTYNQTSISNRTLSINGTVEATNTTSFTSTATTAYLGANNNNGTMVQFGKPNLAQLQIYNRALSPQEVLQNYNASKTRFGL